MAFREVTVPEVKEVLRLWRDGVSKRRIAAQLGLDVKTVRRYLKQLERAGLEPGTDLDPSHKPLGSRPTTAGFPQRPRAAAAIRSTQNRRVCFAQTAGLELLVKRRTPGGMFLKGPGPILLKTGT